MSQRSGYTYLPSSTLDTLKNIEFIARYLVEGGMLGLHRSPYRGFSSEFAEYRKYSPGDNVKYVDWKTYARSDRYYIKCFEEETNLKSFVLLDTSASMGMSADGKESIAKFNYACYLTAAFLYLANQQRDACGLYTWADTVGPFDGCSNSMSHLNLLFRRLEELKPAGESRSGACLNAVAGRIPRRSLVILFSDFFDRDPNFIRALHQLTFKQCEVILFQVLNPDERSFPYSGLIRFTDMETRSEIEVEAESIRSYYLNSLKRYNRKLRDFCDSLRITFDTVSTDMPFERALMTYFSKREVLF